MSHRVFEFRMATLEKVLARYGAVEVTSKSHTPLPRTATKKQSRMLSYKELKSSKGITYTRQHLDRLEEAGKFPKRIKIGARVYWYEHEVDEYVQAHAEARSGGLN